MGRIEVKPVLVHDHTVDRWLPCVSHFYFTLQCAGARADGAWNVFFVCLFSRFRLAYVYALPGHDLGLEPCPLHLDSGLCALDLNINININGTGLSTSFTRVLSPHSPIPAHSLSPIEPLVWCGLALIPICSHPTGLDSSLAPDGEISII